MSITLEEVQHIAKLARIELTRTELEDYQTQLSAILAYFERLQALDTEEPPPNGERLTPKIELRQDQPVTGLNLKELTRNAADVEVDQFRVPPVFD